ncbi:MAG: hypothetical protein ABIN91_15925 [Mucilaginibacter sp.]|uniref:hypothetical protein n=1 Tax=Mucilaginibacter sp. TaxID=1882438 RepID=UPI00326797F7
MKTSTKLLAGAIVILIIAIGIYNNALKAEFVKGKYKKPYHNYKDMGLKGFTKVEINGSGLVEVEFKQGDYKVYNSKFNKDSLQILQSGDKLIINVNLKEAIKTDTNKATGVIVPVSMYRSNYNRVTIICPRLSAITTSNTFLINDKAAGNHGAAIAPLFMNDKTFVNNYNRVQDSFYYDLPQLDISGFKLDSLLIVQNGNGKLLFQNSVIGDLKLTAGAFTSVNIGQGNHIKSAELKINAGSQLVLSNVFFPKLTYQISDSARVSISGISLKSFIK